MVTRSVREPEAAERLSMGWLALALAVFASMLVAEYWGPVIGIAFAVGSCGFAMLCLSRGPTPRFPAPGFWLVAIFAVGAVSAVLASVSGATPLDIDVQRDIGISLSYILFFVVGYYFASSRSTFRLLLTVIIAAGLFISVIHLFKVTTVLSSGVSDLYLFRLEAGRGSETQVAAVCACLLLLSDIRERNRRRVLVGCAALLVISLLLTLSRGLMLSLIVLVLGMMGIGFDRSGRAAIDLGKLLIAAASAVVAVVGAYYAIVLYLPAVHTFIDEFFITRLTNSANEVSATNLQTRTQIADNYRAFEASQTILQFDRQPLYAQLIGQGFGSVVRFGLETASTKVTFSRTEASFLHNGYAYFLMKGGIVAVLMYAGFLVHLVARALNGARWPADGLASTQRKVLLVLAVCLAIETVTTGGLGFPATYLGMAVTLGACCGPIWSSRDADPAPHAPAVAGEAA